jgi:hypothetical protein
MPRNSSGVYSLFTPGNPVVPSTVISTTWANNTLTDIATALSDSLSRSGNGPMTAPLQLANGAIGAPGLTWSTEPTAGFYRASAGNFRFAIGGVDVFTITSAGIAGLGANPSASIGLTAVNGVANTYMRSDAAPALSQSIVPTWTGVHTFSARPVLSDGITINDSGRNVASLVDTALTFGNTTDNPPYTFAGTGLLTAARAALTLVSGQETLTVMGAPSQYAGRFTGDAGAGTSKGVYIRAGTNSSDFPLVINNRAESATIMLVYGDGSVTVGNAPTGGAQGAGTINATNFFVNGVSLLDIGQVSSSWVRGKVRVETAGVTLNTSDMSASYVFAFYNNSGSSVTLTQGAGVTMRLGGTTTTGSRTIPARGWATIYCVSGTECVVFGTSIT